MVELVCDWVAASQRGKAQVQASVDSLVELAEQVLSGIEDVEVLDALEEVAFTSDEQSLRASLTQYLPQQ